MVKLKDARRYRSIHTAWQATRSECFEYTGFYRRKTNYGIMWTIETRCLPCEGGRGERRCHRVVDNKSEWHDDPCCPNCKSDKHGHVREYPDCCCLVGIARSEG